MLFSGISALGSVLYPISGAALPYKWSSWLFDGLSPLVMYKSVVSLSVLNAWGIKLTILSGLSYLGQLSEETCTVCVLFS